MLKFLEKRAVALRSANFEKATKIEHEMTQFKDANLKMLLEPNTAYLTFKYEEAYLKCLERFEKTSSKKDKPDTDDYKMIYQEEELEITRAN